MDTLLNNLYIVFTHKEPLMGLILPFFISIIFLFNDSLKKERVFNFSIITFLFFSTVLLNLFTVEYHFENGIEFMSFTSFSILFVWFYLFYTKQKISLGFVFYFSFFTSLVTDIIAAPNPPEELLYGIGGAGLFDGLLLIPIIHSICFYIFNYVRLNQKAKEILY